MIASAELSLVQGYIDAVLSGEAVVGKLVRAAVTRHVEDIARQRTDDFPYWFDADEAANAIAFFPSCLRHTIGDYAGQPFYLEPWQAFGTANIFGWKRVSDGTRRFRRVYWSQGRKNGKSTFAGGCALKVASMDFNPVTMQIEQVAEVILAATKREQVEKVMFAEIKRMREGSPALKKRSKFAHNQVTFDHNGGYIRCIGSDKPYSGLNPLMVIKDETHELREYHRKFIDTMETGGGSRSQPIDMETTTAGDTSSEIWKQSYEYCRRVVLGDIKDESVFAYCFEIDIEDDTLNPKNWPKSNPNLGISVKESYLEDKANEAKNDPVKLNTFNRFHANQIVSPLSRAFKMADWDACSGKLSDWSTADAIGGGIDLGGRDDFAAWALVARFETGEFIQPDPDAEPQPVYRYEPRIGVYLWDESPRVAKKPFADWIYSDILNAVRYPISSLKVDLVAACFRDGVADVAYDPAGGQHLAEQIANEGILIASMAQNSTHFNEPITDMMASIREKRFSHDGNPLLRWCVSNAVMIQNAAGKCMFDKANSDEKIDPVVAMTMAYRRAMVAPRKPSGKMFIAG